MYIFVVAFTKKQAVARQAEASWIQTIHENLKEKQPNIILVLHYQITIYQVHRTNTCANSMNARGAKDVYTNSRQNGNNNCRQQNEMQ